MDLEREPNGSSFPFSQKTPSQHVSALPGLELNSLNVPENSDSSGTTSNRRVRPADGGIHAWLFLAGCFIFEGIIWGFPFSFGVFQAHYATHTPFASQNGIASIGTCATGVMYLFAPVSLYVLSAYPRIRPFSSVLGLALAVTALLAASTAHQVWQLVLTQGVLYAIGGSALYSPTMFYLDEWFVDRKGLAFGIMWAGVGTAGLILPFLLTYSLAHTGTATTLRIAALVLLFLCSPLVYFIKPRLPPASTASPPPSFAFLHNSIFWAFFLSSTIESLGFFIPSIYLPLYVRGLGKSDRTATLLLSLMNASSVIGAIGLGALTDRVTVRSALLVSTVGTGIACSLWGVSVAGRGGVAGLVLFVIGYGVFAGGFSALWAGMVGVVEGEADQRSGSAGGIAMGLISAGRGIGAVICGPVSAVIFRRGGWIGLVSFTAGTAILGGLLGWFGGRKYCR